MITLKQLCDEIGIEFNFNDIEISGINTLELANASELSFLTNPKYAKDLETTKAGAVFVTSDVADKVPENVIALVVDKNAYLYMAKASKYFAPPLIDLDAPVAVIGKNSYVAPNAYVASGAIVGENCHIMAGVSVGSNCKIGNNVTLHANVSVYRDCIINDNCSVHSGTVIGSDGFGYAHTDLGEHVKIYQNGNVILEEDVELGANCTIDCAVFGSTIIKRGAKLDNLVQIGHNCIIGEHTIMVSQSGSAGSTTMGRNVVIGGQAAVAGHLTIAPFTTLASRAGVTKSIKESGKTYAGFPLYEHREWLKLQGKVARLLKK
jgi:UDP-3-O-[3-hydroxymyristoyl] glucosamine N-acyltransferase